MSGIRINFKVERPRFFVDVDLQLPGRGVVALFGPSGSGKTTCLRAIAGLERAAGAYVSVNGAVWQDESRGVFLATHQRPVGYVFQEAVLFDHLNIQRNVEYGMNRVPMTERRVSLEQVVELLGIGHLLTCKPATLSTGERQRVGIARALAVSPALLLMDEPLAALDHSRKNEILPYLERLHGELEIPIIYVSHVLGEVARLADHVVLLDGGRVIASGEAVDIMARLDTPLTRSDMAGALIVGTINGHDPENHLTYADFHGGNLALPYHDAPIGQPVRLRILARDVSITTEKQIATSILNILPVTVQALSDDNPGQVMVALDAGGVRILARVTRKSIATLQLEPGRAVYAQIKSVAVLRVAD